MNLLRASALGLVFAACTSNNPSPDVADTGSHTDATMDTPADGTVASLPVDQTEQLAGLEGPVDVVVDRYGWPHIYATTLRDLAYVQGLLEARDRMAEMELFRRAAEGTLADAFGAVQPSIIEEDLTMRIIGLHRTAQQIWDAVPAHSRARDMVEGYTDGVNHYLQNIHVGAEAPPPGTDLVVNTQTPPWTPVDCLAIGRLQALTQSYITDEEIRATEYRQHAHDTFETADPIASPALAARRGFFWDFYRFAAPSTTNVVPEFFSTLGMHDTFHPSTLAVRVPDRTLQNTRPFFEALREVTNIMGGVNSGSNNFVVDAAHSSTHHALLENDPHMDLPSPPIWWGMHGVVTQGPDATEFAGTSVPGTPGVVIGFTRHVAWGATNAFYDQVDEYLETVVPGTGGAPDSVVFQGHNVPIQTIVEDVSDGLGGTVHANIEFVPQHGPISATISNGRIQPRTGTTAITIKWAGMQPSNELDTLAALLYAQNVNDARNALSSWAVPALNFVFADTDGNIAYASTSSVAVRAPGARTWDPMTNTGGTLPCVVLPGTGEAEWTGNLTAAQMPNALGGPMHPFFVTANNDQAGESNDNNPLNDPVYLGCKWAMGFRAERITTRLTALGSQIAVPDMVSVQSDHMVLTGARLEPFIDQAMTHLEEEWTTPGTHPDLTAFATTAMSRATQLRDAHTRLSHWSFNGESGVEPGASAMVQADSIATTIFHAWLVKFLGDAFGDELNAMGVSLGGITTDFVRTGAAIFLLEHPDQAYTVDATSHQSIVWDDLTTPAVESRDLIIVRALDEALSQLATTTMTPDVTHWQWGNLHTIRFGSIIPGPGSVLSIPPENDSMFPHGFPRWGGIDVVDASEPGTDDFDFTFDGGPSQRYVVEMDPTGPKAVNALPGGESIDINSPHHADDAELWRTNAPHPIPFNEADVVAAHERRLHFDPM